MKYWKPFNIAFNIIGNLIFLVILNYLWNDWYKMITLDRVVGIIGVLIFVVVHIALFIEWKYKK